jgi:hypothetical protein
VASCDYCRRAKREAETTACIVADATIVSASDANKTLTTRVGLSTDQDGRGGQVDLEDDPAVDSAAVRYAAVGLELQDAPLVLEPEVAAALLAHEPEVAEPTDAIAAVRRAHELLVAESTCEPEVAERTGVPEVVLQEHELPVAPSVREFADAFPRWDARWG